MAANANRFPEKIRAGFPEGVQRMRKAPRLDGPEP
jgi:hypothetical protein